MGSTRKNIEQGLRFLLVLASMFSLSHNVFASIEAKLIKVESSKVCMVNDQVFPNDLIPVTVGDKTYFGCCAMCKISLSTDEQVRMAVDPVSKKHVDKADAIIGVDVSGKIYYFESEENLGVFNKVF